MTMNTTSSPSNAPRKPNTKPTSGRPKGKSKFAQKSRGKKFVKPVKAVLPTSSYTSVCCGVPATKPACTKASKVKGAPPMSLGTWRCTGCKKVAKVTVSKFKAPESLTANTEVPIENPSAN